MLINWLHLSVSLSPGLAMNRSAAGGTGAGWLHVYLFMCRARAHTHTHTHKHRDSRGGAGFARSQRAPPFRAGTRSIYVYVYIYSIYSIYIYASTFVLVRAAKKLCCKIKFALQNKCSAILQANFAIQTRRFTAKQITAILQANVIL